MREAVTLTGKQADAAQGQLVAVQGQLSEMEAQSHTSQQLLNLQAAISDPRLRVSVHAEDFAPDKKPIFIVTINNDGLIAATNVAFKMVVKWLGREERLKDVFDVPAKDTEIQHLVSNGVLTDLQFKSFNESAPLIVEGTLSYFPYQRKDGDPPQPFCYKYHPWKGDRPEGIPQFIRCERATTVDLAVQIEGARLTLTPGDVTVRIEPVAPDDISPDEEIGPDNEDES
jgi:hypothetical protein